MTEKEAIIFYKLYFRNPLGANKWLYFMQHYDLDQLRAIKADMQHRLPHLAWTIDYDHEEDEIR